MHNLKQTYDFALKSVAQPGGRGGICPWRSIIKNIAFENSEWHFSILIIALSVFVTICIFLDAYNVHKPSNKNFAPVRNQTFRLTNKCTATLNKNRQFV